ncbi:MAG: hypothetical protein QXR34_00040 [Saccharolobus sp.]
MEVLLENSRSKSNKHVIRSLLYKVENDELVQAELSGKKVMPIYKVGDAKIVNIPNKGIYIYVYLLRNIQGKVYGRATVIDNGNLALVMKYRKLKLKLIDGDPQYSKYIKRLFDKLKMPVKKINVKKVNRNV